MRTIVFVLCVAARLACLTPCCGKYTGAFLQAFEETFALQSGATGVSNDAHALRRIRDLMLRGGFPVDETKARECSDTQLLRMSMLAAVGGISPWRRHQNLTDKVLIDDDGGIMPRHTLKTMESHIMLCVVCALLTVIAFMNLAAARPASTV